MPMLTGKPYNRLWLLCGLLLLSFGIASAQDTPLFLYFQHENTIALINTGDASIKTIAELPAPIKCSQPAGGWVYIAHEQGIDRLNRTTTHTLEILLDVTDLGAVDDVIITCPLVAPDEDWLYFRTITNFVGALHRIRVDGTGLETLIPHMGFSSDHIERLKWSYDNENLIFYAGIDDDWGYWALSANNEERHLLNNLTHAQLTAASSPDQQSITYSVRRETGLIDVWVNDMLIYSLADKNLDAFPPVWSADGAAVQLIYWDWRELDMSGTEGAEPSGEMTALAIAPDGSETSMLSQIANDKSQLTGIAAPPPPLWSPDRNWALLPYGTLLNLNTGASFDLASGIAFVWQSDSQALWFIQSDPEMAGGHLMRFDTNTLELADVVALGDVTNSCGCMQLGLWNG
jgi:hypothetical protein